MASQAEPRRPAPPSPRLPERYRPIRRIAAGGSATVWCAEDSLLGRRVAVKLLAEPYASDSAAVRRFKREARAAARLSGHRHVVTIFDVGETGPGAGQPFIVMEHLAGGTVADALRLHAVGHADAVRWVAEAAAAIDYAHAKGVVHRDIKPANLLLDRDRTLYVADFGIAQIGHEEGHTRPGQVLGTAAYLAPERALGRPATIASDLYSLAVAAFELLTGQRPFQAAAYVAQARQHLEQEPPRASERDPHLPTAVDDVLRRGMAKWPEQRWPSAEAFAGALERALAPRADPHARRVAAVARARRSIARAPSRSQVSPAPAARPTSSAPPAASPLPRSVAAGRRRLPLGFAAGALASLILLATILAFGASGGGPAQHAQAVGAPVARAMAKSPPGRSAARTPPTGSAAAPSGSAATAGPSGPVPPPAAGGAASHLEAMGHALLSSGRAAEAVWVLHQAVLAAGTDTLTYAYALFDLGRALRLAGDPRDAVSVLMQRLQIPNQTDTVRAELALAREAASLGGGD